MITGRDKEFTDTINFYYQKILLRKPDPEGFASFLKQLQEGMTGPELEKALLASEEYKILSTRPPPIVLHLEVRGNDFVDKDGQRVSFPGCDGFMDYRIWLDKGEAGLKPFMEESKEIGFVVRRVFMAGAIEENTVMDLRPLAEPNYYKQLVPFVKYQNSFGQIPLLTINVDSQKVMPKAADRLAHWKRVNAELAGKNLFYLMSGGNEYQKNGFDPYVDVDSPGPGVIWSRASGLQDETTVPAGATASEFHPVRGEARTQMDAVASVFYMREHGCGMLWMDEPLGFNTVNEPGRRSNSPQLAWQLGRLYSTLWALAVFHNSQGQRGQLLEPVTRQCAEAWVRGMKL